MLKIRIITPERVVYQGEAASVQFPAEDGLVGVHPGHAAMISLVGPGVLSLKSSSGKEHHFFVSRGFAQISNDELRFAIDAGEDEDEIDIERAREAAARAKKRLGERRAKDFDLVRAEFAMRRAVMRLRTKRTTL